MKYPNNEKKIRGGIVELGSQEINPIQKLLRDLPQTVWESHLDPTPNPNKKGVILRKTSHVTFKFTKRRNGVFKIHFSPLWECWKPILMPILENTVRVYGYDQGHFPIIMLAKLPPKCPIIPHSDGTMDYYAPHKIHIPIETNDKAYFFINKQRYHFEEGCAYEVDNIAEHGVLNAGETDRVHLIFEYMFGEERGEKA